MARLRSEVAVAVVACRCERRPVLERLWNGWRTTYVSSVPPHDGRAAGAPSIFTDILRSGLPDEETHIVHRGETVFAILNAYPYATAHTLVLPYREVPDLEDLTPAEHAELWATVTDAVRAIKVAYRPEGLNVGLNLGRPAGGSVAQHLHVHVVPRWTGDTNFMTATANTRTIPEALPATWPTRLRSAWPEPDRTSPSRWPRSPAWRPMDDEVRDQLPEDLDASGYVGPYQFPDNSRRRVPGVIYLVIAVTLPDHLPGPTWRGTLCSSTRGSWARRPAGRRGRLLDHQRLADDGRRAPRPGHRHQRGRLPGRSRLGAAGLAGPAQPPDLAHPVLLDRGATPAAGLRADRRHRRPRGRAARRGQPRGLDLPTDRRAWPGERTTSGRCARRGRRGRRRVRRRPARCRSLVVARSGSDVEVVGSDVRCRGSAAPSSADGSVVGGSVPGTVVSVGSTGRRDAEHARPRARWWTARSTRGR